MKDMSITFFTIKGGVGKTTLSVQVAQMLGYDYITNDGHSAVVDLLDEDRALLVSESEKEIPFFKNVVYDFGGFKDLRIKNIIENSDVVVIPTLMSRNDIKATIATLEEVSLINKNIVIVLNRSKSIEKAEELKEFLKDEIKLLKIKANISYVIIREANVLELSSFDCESIVKKAKANKFSMYIYRNVIEDMSNLIQTIVQGGIK
ncbi:ParA family protein [Aliarcobacter butzleri]|uniref:ParA family protein n=1 Tax=Aliarcobacter butzleri TaxID=28197 RepID=UPI0024DE5782|nr:ParA family protein [Aliarcobacter butzleri]MDK2063345.1 ParA family protein [Aliarcobacter butzleri]